MTAIFLVLAMTVCSVVIQSKLMEPKTLEQMTITHLDEIGENGEPRTETVTEPNPHYIGEPLRSVYKTLNDLLPTSQLIRMETPSREMIRTSEDGDLIPAGFYFSLMDGENG